MKASFDDLWKKSDQIIQALKRHERITVLYRGEAIATMHPAPGVDATVVGSARQHAAFGLWATRDEMKDVAAHVRRCRDGRSADR